MFGDEIWDEERWEKFLKKDDERAAHYMKILNRFLDVHPPPRPDDQKALQTWRDAFRAYLVRYGWGGDEMDSSMLHDGHTDEHGVDEPVPEAESDLFGFKAEYIFAELTSFPLYQEAYTVMQRVLNWSDGLPGPVKDSSLVQFCANVMQITANIAKGNNIGLEREMLGGNIACLKRAINVANITLSLLQEMRTEPYMRAHLYLGFYEDIYELRNAIGIYIQDLRFRFNMGID